LAAAAVLNKTQAAILVDLEGERVVPEQSKPAGQLLLDKVMQVEIRKTPECPH
jgi:hypothetical protein